MDLLERISTGVPGLDPLIEGGIPKGSTVMIAGKSRSGKTILCAQFLYYGLINKNENGLYISFSESKAQFYINIKTLGMDFDKFERQGKFTYLDFTSLTKDGIQDILEEILATIRTTSPIKRKYFLFVLLSDTENKSLYSYYPHDHSDLLLYFCDLVINEVP